MPRQWWLISLYMIFIYCVYLGMIHYARQHPIVDERPAQAQEQGAQ